MINPQVNKERWAMYNFGLFDRQIAELQGVNKNSVVGWRKARNLPPNQQQWFVLRKQEVQD